MTNIDSEVKTEVRGFVNEYFTNDMSTTGEANNHEEKKSIALSSDQEDEAADFTKSINYDPVEDEEDGAEEQLSSFPVKPSVDVVVDELDAPPANDGNKEPLSLPATTTSPSCSVMAPPPSKKGHTRSHSDVGVLSNNKTRSYHSQTLRGGRRGSHVPMSSSMPSSSGLTRLSPGGATAIATEKGGASVVSGSPSSFLCAVSRTSDVACNDSSVCIKRSFLRDGGKIVPATECFFPRPHEGQTLTSFLTSGDFNICAALDKENAHFYISEAMIAALEQMQCRHRSGEILEEEEEVESDEEIRSLKQRIRMRRQEKIRKATSSGGGLGKSLLSDGKTDDTGTTASPGSTSSTSCCDSRHSSLTSDDDDSDVDDLSLSDDHGGGRNGNSLASSKSNGLSLSMASLYSEADLMSRRCRSSKASDYSCVGGSSAEAVALSLLKKIPKKQLPKASDLVWLVSEKDAPQELLPLPTDSMAMFEGSQQFMGSLRTRGTTEWAPPRAQIIFDVLPLPKRSVQIAKQNYCCAGCGVKICPSKANRLRYCHYLGKFFCHYCHTNAQAFIPGNIIRLWDFNRYKVSDFSANLLEDIFTDPLFVINDINPSLFRKVRNLRTIRELRHTLQKLSEYIITCRRDDGCRQLLKRLPKHIITDPEAYSVQDLLKVKCGDLVFEMERIVSRCLKHVQTCPLCQARGFICELCRRGEDIIFPFQWQKVVQCKACRSCFHVKCHAKKAECPKCYRIRQRRITESETAVEC